jgi:TetR/AcrR family transcriptional regulator, transcriptional repressor of bet genes
MPLIPIRNIRRQQLLEAAFEIMKREGLQNATIEKIAKEAGVSEGNIHHYFESKEELIELSIRLVLDLRRKELVKRLEQSQTPSERLWAVIALNLDPKYLEPGFCRFWISFSAEATEQSRSARILKALHARERSNLIYSLKLLHHEPNVRSAALALKLQFEGARQRAGFLTIKYSPHRECAHLLMYLKQNIPNFDVSAAEKK